MGQQLLFLFERDWFRFVHSQSHPDWSEVTLESASTRLILQSSRGERSATLGPITGAPSEQILIGVYRRLLDGDRSASDMLDQGAVVFLNRHLRGIDFDFSDEISQRKLVETLKRELEERVVERHGRIRREAPKK